VSRIAARLAAAGGACAALVAAGCGLGSGSDGPRAVTLTVTRDFGARTVGVASADRAPGGETVMRFLQRRFRVQTRFGGGFVQSIEGLSGTSAGGRRVDWFYYVNGIEASRGAAAWTLHRGDRVWWDRHDWGAAIGVPAVVGSFPEPFRSGSEGRRLPVRLSCTAGAGAACEEAERRLADAGVAAGRAALGSAGGEQVLRVLVGPWRGVRGDPVARRIERGAAASGVYARPAAGGRRLVALDQRGRPARVLAAGAGLVAATRLRDQQPTWVVTGTDPAGVLSAARSLTEPRLRNHFALALERGQPLRLPVEEPA
jgi:hypothetical protein